MPSASELRAELKEMRKSHPEHMPVSKMKKSDVSDLIQKMKLRLEETPPVATVKSVPSKMYKSAVESVKTAKASEFPTEIHSHAEPPAKHSKKAPATKPKKNVVPEMKKAEAKAHAEIKKGRPAKGSEDARAHMAKIRGMKGKKPADE
jgi:uncharacterized membrane protein